MRGTLWTAMMIILLGCSEQRASSRAAVMVQSPFSADPSDAEVYDSSPETASSSAVRAVLDVRLLPSEAASPEGFAPSSWELETSVGVDLDARPPEDVALLLIEQGATGAARQRALVFALAGPSGNYRRIATALRLIRFCSGCSATPESTSTINLVGNYGAYTLLLSRASEKLQSSSDYFSFALDHATKRIVLTRRLSVFNVAPLEGRMLEHDFTTGVVTRAGGEDAGSIQKQPRTIFAEDVIGDETL